MFRSGSGGQCLLLCGVAQQFAGKLFSFGATTRAQQFNRGGFSEGAQQVAAFLKIVNQRAGFSTHRGGNFEQFAVFRADQFRNLALTRCATTGPEPLVEMLICNSPRVTSAGVMKLHSSG